FGRDSCPRGQECCARAPSREFSRQDTPFPSRQLWERYQPQVGSEEPLLVGSVSEFLPSHAFTSSKCTDVGAPVVSASNFSRFSGESCLSGFAASSTSS